MKRNLILWSLFLLMACRTYGQVTLDQCRHRAVENYPLVRQYALIEKTSAYNVSNAAKGYLPQFSLSGKATIQSEVTELPIKIQGMEIKPMPKEQYQLVAELKQNIWDGGEVRMRKALAQASTAVEREQLNVDMYALNARIDDLFFGILLLDEQLEQNRLLQADLERTAERVSAYLTHGIAGLADLDAVKVELLNTRQKQTELLTSKEAYVQMLSLFTGEALTTETSFEKPPVCTLPERDATIHRPELLAFDAQRAELNIKEKNLKVRYRPHIALFAQGAYGNPGLNMLKDKFSFYYIGGVRLSWNFGSLYTLKNDRQLLENARRRVDSHQDTFLFNTRLQMTQQSSGISALRRQMTDDEEIIRLRTNIRRAAEAKVENGTMTVTDLLHEMTAERLAHQTKALHEVQWLMKIYQLKQTANQ
ncbi:MAG: TolC family protein [Bacteroidia bacterium]|nr:TolC family protein [Bacteroidia bacterium]